MGVGVETVGTDAGAAGGFDPPFPVHHFLLGAGKYGLTQLANLAELPPVGRRDRRGAAEARGRDRQPDAGAGAGRRLSQQLSGAVVGARGEDPRQAPHAPALGALEPARALGEVEGQLAAEPERVGDQVAVVERDRRPQLVADLGEQHDAARWAAGVELGEAGERVRRRRASPSGWSGGARRRAARARRRSWGPSSAPSGASTMLVQTCRHGPPCGARSHIGQMERFRAAGPLPRRGRAQVGEDRGHAPIRGALVAQVELDEDLADARSRTASRAIGQALGDGLVGEALGDEPEDLALALGELGQRAAGPGPRVTRRSTISGSTTQPPLATRRTASSSVSISPTRSLIR